MYILVGAGGHARVILDILLKEKKKVLGFIDDNKVGTYEDFPIVGTTADTETILGENSSLKFIICVGDNQIRERIANTLNNYNVEYGNAIHPSAEIGSGVKLGFGTVVMANVVVNHSAHVGNHAIVNTAATVDHDCEIGDFVHISPGAHLAGSVMIRKGCHIGIGSSIIQNITVGPSSIIGAGAAVVSNIEGNALAVGVPAKIIKKRSDT